MDAQQQFQSYYRPGAIRASQDDAGRRVIDEARDALLLRCAETTQERVNRAWEAAGIYLQLFPDVATALRKQFSSVMSPSEYEFGHHVLGEVWSQVLERVVLARARWAGHEPLMDDIQFWVDPETSEGLAVGIICAKGRRQYFLLAHWAVEGRVITDIQNILDEVPDRGSARRSGSRPSALRRPISATALNRNGVLSALAAAGMSFLVAGLVILSIVGVIWLLQPVLNMGLSFVLVLGMMLIGLGGANLGKDYGHWIIGGALGTLGGAALFFAILLPLDPTTQSNQPVNVCNVRATGATWSVVGPDGTYQLRPGVYNGVKQPAVTRQLAASLNGQHLVATIHQGRAQGDPLTIRSAVTKGTAQRCNPWN